MSVAQNIILPSTLNKWNLQNLDYNWYFALTVLGGYFGLDYLYLGSPLGAFAKFLFNTQTYGFMWFYDAINAAISQDQVRLFGPVAPVIGATGIAAGRFRDSKYPNGPQDKLDKHLNFMIYGIVLCMFGFVGGDSFLTGHFFNGVIRLFCVIFFIGIPISLFWWATNMYYYFLDTGAAIDQHWEYFGTEAPGDQSAECPNVLQIFTVWLLKTGLAIMKLFPFTGEIASMVETLIASLEVAYGFVKPVVEETVNAVVPMMEVVDAGKNRPVPTVAELKKPIGTSAAADMTSKLSKSIKLPGMPDVSKMKDMAGKIPDMSKMPGIPAMPDMSKVPAMPRMPDLTKVPGMPDLTKVTDMAGKIPKMPEGIKMPSIPKMPEGIKMPSIPKMPEGIKMPTMPKMPEEIKMPSIPKMPMVGGGETDSSEILGPILVLTIGFVVVSGIIVSLRRSRQNANANAATASTSKQLGDQETDEPPVPGNLRNPTPAD